MNKKIIVALLALFLAIGLLWALFRYTSIFKKSQPNQETKITGFSNQMDNGTVKEAKNGSIVVDGSISSLDPENSSQEHKTIEFIITPQTILKKSTIGATLEQMKSGKPFHPETKITAGNISDLIVGVGMFKIVSKDNLFEVNKATATQIDYIIYDFPSPATN